MPEKRERWGGRLPFVMAAVGSAVGLGNVWRFPAVAYQNGGGAFLVPYFVALITAGIPLMIVEYTLGQKFQKGAPEALASVNPKFRWVGWFALLVATVITFYYIAIMAWAWHYSIASAGLEWTKPAPVRVEKVVGAVEKTIGAKSVVLYLRYEDEEHRKRLEKVVAGTDIALLSEADLRKMSPPETGPEQETRTYFLSLNDKDNVLLDNVVLYVKEGEGEGKTRKLASGFEILTLTDKELERRLTEEGKKPAAERNYYVSVGAEGKRYVSLDQNVKHYFREECLGGFAPEQWAESRAHNAAIDKNIAELNEQKSVLARNGAGGAAAERGADIDSQIGKLESERIPYVRDMFRLPWKTAMWCGITWLAIFLILFKGVRVVGKVVMWTVSLPVVLLAVLLVRGITLEGSTQGIIYYLTPTWDKLADPSVWLAAYGQIFFSLSLGFGILIAYASYQPKNADVTNNAFLTAFANCATSFFAAFAVFSVLGYLASINKTDVGSVVNGGPGLVFVTYPIAIAKIGGVWGRIVGVTFFGCLLLLGIDSAFSLVEGAMTGVTDRFPRLNKTFLTAAFCVVGFCGSLVFATSSGLMWLDIVDNWMSNYGLAAVGLLECIAVSYFFRHQEIEEFANARSEIHLGGWFELFIKYVTPAVLVFLLGVRFTEDMVSTYGGYDSILPWSVSVAGWGVVVTLLAIALALGRNWTKFLWLVSAGAVFVLFLAWLGRSDVAAMAAVGVVLLFGGFFTCLRLAMKDRGAGPAVPEE